MKYPTQHQGEWVQPKKRNFRLMCCDCSLVHRMDFRIVNGNVEYRVHRDNRATAAARRKKKSCQQ